MLQKAVWEHFEKKFGGATYKKIVELTGLEQTRLFRIRNGARMYLDEFEVFLELIGDRDNGLKLFMDCYRTLDSKSLNDLELIMERKMNLDLLKKGA